MSERSWELGQATNEAVERAKEGNVLPCAGISNPEGPGPSDDNPLPKEETRELLPPRPPKQPKKAFPSLRDP